MSRTFLVLGACLWASAVHAQGDLEGARTLERFRGNWQVVLSQKPAKWTKLPGKRQVKDNAIALLKDRYIVTRGIDEATGMKSLWLLTYDPKTKSYPSWYFDSNVLGGEWRGSWDEPTQTLTMTATDTPMDWTSRSTIAFPDAKSAQAKLWMKDGNGDLLVDTEYQKSRLGVDAGEKILTDWSRVAADAKITPEMKRVGRFVGTWDAELLYRAAEWTPQEKRATRTVQCQWILDGQFLQTLAIDSDGLESLFLLGYDPQLKAYRQWRFTADGQTGHFTGHWDDVSNSITMKSELPNRLSFRMISQFTGADNHDWNGLVTDAEGKRYFHMEGRATRRK